MRAYKILFLALLLQICITETVNQYKLEIKNGKGDDEQIVLVPGVFTPITLVLTSLGGNDFDFQETDLTYTLTFKDEKIVALTEKMTLNPKESLVYKTFIGLHCSHSIEGEEHTLDISIDDTSLVFDGVTVKINNAPTTIDLDLLLESMIENSKNFFTLKNEIYNVDEIKIDIENPVSAQAEFDLKQIVIAKYNEREEYSKDTNSNHGILFDFPVILSKLLEKAKLKLNLNFAADMSGTCFKFAKTEFDLDLKTEGFINLDGNVKTAIIYNTEDGSPKFDISNKIQINTVIPVAPVILECKFTANSTISNNGQTKLQSSSTENVYKTVITASGKVDITMDNLQADTEYFAKCEIRNTSSLDNYINFIDITIGNFDGADIVKKLLPSRDPNATPQCAKFTFKSSDQNKLFSTFGALYCKYYMKKSDNILARAIPSIVAQILDKDDTSSTLCVAPSPLYNLGKYISQKETEFNNRFDNFVEHIKKLTIGDITLEVVNVDRTYDIEINPSSFSALLVDTEGYTVPIINYNAITKYSFELLSTHSQPVECTYSAFLTNENSKFATLIDNIKKVTLQPNVKQTVEVGPCLLPNLDIKNMLGDDNYYSLKVKCYNLPGFLFKYETSGTMNLYSYYNAKTSIDQIIERITNLEINCNEKVNKLNPRCIKEKVVSIIDNLKTEIPAKIAEIEKGVEQFINTAKSVKEKIIKQLKEEFEEIINNSKSTIKEVVEKAIDLLKHLSYYDCSIYVSGSANTESETIKGGIYIECRELKQNVVDTIINYLKNKLTCPQLTLVIESQAISNDLEENLKYILFLINELSNNPESFKNETSQIFIELVECLQEKFDEYWPKIEEYLKNTKQYLDESVKAVKKDVEKVILKTLENLAELIHFDQLDGYIATAKEEITKTGLIVYDKAKEIQKKIVEFAKKLNEFGAGNYTFSGSMFANVEINDGLNIEADSDIKVSHVEDKDILILTHSNFMLRKYGAYALQTLVFDSPIVSVNASIEASGTSDTVNTFVSITLYDKDHNEITVKDLEKALGPKILYLKEKYEQLKTCFYYDENTNELKTDGLTLETIEYEGKKYLQCVSSHLTSFTAGTAIESSSSNTEEEKGQENGGNTTLIIVLSIIGVILLLVILFVVIIMIKKRNAKVTDKTIDQTFENKNDGLVNMN